MTFWLDGDPHLKTSVLNFVVIDESGSQIYANESSLQTSSPFAYCDYITPWVGDTRQIVAYVYTKPSLVTNKYRVHAEQQWTTWTNTTGTGPIRKGSLENWSEVQLSLYDSNNRLLGGPSTNQTVQSDVLGVVISVKDPLSNGSVIIFNWGKMKWYSLSTDPKSPSWCEQAAWSYYALPPEDYRVDQKGGQRHMDCWFDPKVGT